jgi:hypothetical protein
VARDASSPRAASSSRRAHASRESAAAKRTRKALAQLYDAGQLDEETYASAAAGYDDALKTLGKLKGTRQTELRAVIADVDALAAAGGLTPSRVPAAFLTLERNRQWWTTGALLRYGQRVGFPDSGLVWQYYPGQGIQIQWLGTFGKANALYSSKKKTQLAALLDEAVPLAGERAGGLAWESLFRFDGGRPPWVSGLTQGTAIQAIARAGVQLKRPDYLEVAKRALGIFRTPPPEGVLVQTQAGAHYLQYSFAPTLHILNGFIQSLVGLHDYAQLAGDDEGLAMFAAGDAQARVEVPGFDTGAWSLYSSAGDWSSLGYHTLLRDFLRNLCTRLQADARRTHQPIDAAVYCDTAQRFTDDLITPPTIQLVTRHARARKPATIAVTLSKPSRVAISLSRGGRVRFSTSVQLQGGRQTIRWSKAGKAALYVVRLSAVDLAGNRGGSGSTLRLRR